MVKRVTRYQADDGQVFDTEQEALEHEDRAAAAEAVKEFVEEKLNDSEDPRDSDDGFLCLDDVINFLLENRKELVEILEF